MLFKCPQCGGERELADKYAGNKIKCPTCKQVCTVASKVESAADDEWDDLVADEPQQNDDSHIMDVSNAIRSTAKSGEARRDFSCPNCDCNLNSTEESFDTCARCGVGLRFADTNTLEDARDRVAAHTQGGKITPFRQWLAVVVGMHLIVIGLMGNTIKAALTSDDSGLSQLLMICYLAALARSFFDIRHIDNETAKARRQVFTLTQGGRLKKLLEKCEDSMLRDHIWNLFEISKRTKDVSQDNLVVLMQSKLHARIRLTEIAGSILITIGLVGTILGLISSFGGIDEVLANVGEDKQKLLAGFNETLGGMGTAFYTTLLGSIFGGVIMRILNAIVVSGTDSLLSRIAELTEVYILPTLKAPKRPLQHRRA